MQYLTSALAAIKEQRHYPKIETVEEEPYPELVIDGKPYLCLCSNNYLGLSIHPDVKKAAIEGVKHYGIGTCESRLLDGNLRILEDLERAIADFKGSPAAVVFLSGYLTNIGIIHSLMDSHDGWGAPRIENKENLIFIDRFSHTSIHNGCRICFTPHVTYRHNDMEHLEQLLRESNASRRLIITDGVFSMDGDFAPLPDIIRLAKKYEAMVLVDDAHATGVVGKTGRGTREHFNLESEDYFVMGTLSKAFGGCGGFLTCSKDVADLIRITAPSYIFTSSLPPSQALALIESIRIARDEPELRERVWRNVKHLRNGLMELGFNLMHTETQIIPVLLGTLELAKSFEQQMFEEGILVSAITWPAVPPDKCRLRCSVNALHNDEQIDRSLAAFKKVGHKLGLI